MFIKGKLRRRENASSKRKLRESKRSKMRYSSKRENRDKKNSLTLRKP
jgi:hypothetical protein